MLRNAFVIVVEHSTECGVMKNEGNIDGHQRGNNDLKPSLGSHPGFNQEQNCHACKASVVPDGDFLGDEALVNAAHLLCPNRHHYRGIKG